MLAAASYLDRDSEEENEIRKLADKLYRRADWKWAINGGATLTHGWKPEKGFLPHRWERYDESTLAYLLGLGSPAFPLPAESYQARTASYEWKEIYDYEYLYSVRSSRISFRIYGSISVEFKTRSCTNTVWIISRTAAAPPMSTRNMHAVTQMAGKASAKFAGD
jgi:hypothetical protein